VILDDFRTLDSTSFRYCDLESIYNLTQEGMPAHCSLGFDTRLASNHDSFLADGNFQFCCAKTLEKATAFSTERVSKPSWDLPRIVPCNLCPCGCVQQFSRVPTENLQDDHVNANVLARTVRQQGRTIHVRHTRKCPVAASGDRRFDLCALG
jgi:hypothetical protein